MKIISLNTYCGKRTKSFVEFLKQYHDVDIFCFQEVYHNATGKDMVWKFDGSNLNLLRDIKTVLPRHNSYYKPHLEDFWGLAMFIKKEFPVLEEGENFVHKFIGYNPKLEPFGHTAKNIQFIKTKNNSKPITIVNFHGLWNGEGKNDKEDRLNQSQNIIKFIKTIGDDFIFCGDFNLSPETESLKMISRELDCRDLIKEYKITSTRTSLYTKPNKFADYVFVSKKIKVIDFKILQDEVSDHSPILIEIG